MSTTSNPSEHDYLNMQNNKQVMKMLHKLGDNLPTDETVILSTKLWKINRKHKKQIRILLLTDKAIYNIKPNKLGSCQRRIMIASVASIISSIAHEFTINIPTEYDYRYKAVNATQKHHIISNIVMLFGKMTRLNLNVHNISQRTTKDYTLTKLSAKQYTDSERYERKLELTKSSDIFWSGNEKLIDCQTDYIANDYGLNMNEYKFTSIGTGDGIRI
eukprot:785600_1